MLDHRSPDELLSGGLGGFGALLVRLLIEPDEAVVVTLVAVAIGAEWRVCFGTVLVGPPAMAAQSWVDWYETQRPGPWSVVEALGATSRPASTWRRFDEATGRWRFLRFEMPVDALKAFLDRALGRRTVVPPGGAAPLQVQAGVADALVRVFPHHKKSPTGRLVAGVGRPVTGWVHPLSTTGAAGEPVLDSRAVPEDGPLRAAAVPSTTLWLAGIATGGFAAPVPPSLLVGRVQRDAWFVNLRGGRPALETFDIDLGLDPARLALEELQLTLEESDRRGDLLAAHQLSLGEVPRPEHGHDRVTVALPTLGSGLVRSLRLYHRDGRLLDAADDVVIAESVHVSVAVGTAPPVVTEVGPDLPAPDLVRRLNALDRTEAEYRVMLAEGVPDRVVAPGEDGRAVLRERLRAARGQLRVADPYFGQAPADWWVLEEVTVPTRVLGHGDLRRPAGPARPWADLRARRWTLRRKKPAFHDRFYLWDGGGLTVGTSASGLGQRLSVISPLEPVVAAQLAGHFELWWTDPGFIDAEDAGPSR